MSDNTGQDMHIKPANNFVDVAIRLAFIGLIIIWCFNIFRPFIAIVAWSSIIAVTAYPFVKKMAGWFGGRIKLAVIAFVVVALALVLLPGIGIVGSIVNSGKSLVEDIENATLKVPPPNASVRDWPVMGEKLFDLWSEAAANLERTVEEYADQVKKGLGWLFSSLATLGVDFVLTLIALIVSGLLMGYAESLNRSSIAFFDRIVGQNGREYSNSSRDTIRSVVKGVILLALIQAFLAWIGMAVAGVPAAGVWAVLVLLVAIMQLPHWIILLPITIYVFSEASSGIAIAFVIWNILVSISDSLLKPILLGRGLQIPMLVILIGAIGGMILHGIIGLFIGAVVMALGYQLYSAWLNDWQIEEADDLAGVPD